MTRDTHDTVPSSFDQFAEDYETALDEGLQLSGEDSTYFAAGRTRWLAKRLDELGVTPTTILDFGCGTGSTVPFLLEMPGSERVVATDDSNELLARARREHASDRVAFQPIASPDPIDADVAYCNGVFHHIEPSARAESVRFVASAVRPGGIFAFWENNPWNPGTHLVMRRIPFDRDAQMLSARRARELLRHNGFDVVRTDYAFFFPNALRSLRRVEPQLARAPFGAQYLVLGRRR